MDIEVGDAVRLRQKRSVTGIVQEYCPTGAGRSPVVERWRVSFDPQVRTSQDETVKGANGQIIPITTQVRGGYYTADELEVTAKHTDSGSGEQPETSASGGKGSRKKKATV